MVNGDLAVDHSDMLLMLTSADVRRLVPMRVAIDTAREAFAAVSHGQVAQPPRMSVADGATLIMAAQGAESDPVVKVISVRPGNLDRGMPLLHAIVLVLDNKTGRPKAVIEGSAVTELRTGAASGLATDLLAAPGACRLAMIGAGAQASCQVEAVCAVRPITELRVASRTPESAQRLVSALAPRLPAVHCVAVASVAEAVAGADVICTATTASAPLFELADLAPTVHINAVGAHRATMCELSPGVLRAASVLAVDQVGAALEEAGDLIQALAAGAIARDGLTELGALLPAGPPPRGPGVTVFKSVGVGAQDWALVRALLARGTADGGLRSLALD
jgi:ornithine cyclodeaminase/alanine dehydrogenase-like protein (mu-crystallin family)